MAGDRDKDEDRDKDRDRHSDGLIWKVLICCEGFGLGHLKFGDLVASEFISALALVRF